MQPKIILRILTSGAFFPNKMSSFITSGIHLINKALNVTVSLDVISNGIIYYALDLQDLIKVCEYTNRIYGSVVKDLKSQANGSNLDEISQLWHVYLDYNLTEDTTEKEVLQKIKDALNPESYFEVKLMQEKSSKRPVLKLRTMNMKSFFKLIVGEYRREFSSKN
ncbi:MAG: hypothetical protein GY870_20810 [archaeon]|nr:hypothetical protein [archaeon]